MKKEIDSWFDKPFMEYYLRELHSTLQSVDMINGFVKQILDNTDSEQAIELMKVSNQAQQIKLQTLKAIKELYTEE